jgi:hypothetical protein
MEKRTQEVYPENVSKFNPGISEERARELFKEIEERIFKASHLAQLLMVIDLRLLNDSNYQPAPGRVTEAVDEVNFALREFGDVLSKLCVNAVDASRDARMECGLIRMRG